MAQRCFQGQRTVEGESRDGQVADAVARAKLGDPAAIRLRGWVARRTRSTGSTTVADGH